MNKCFFQHGDKAVRLTNDVNLTLQEYIRPIERHLDQYYFRREPALLESFARQAHDKAYPVDD